VGSGRAGVPRDARAVPPLPVTAAPPGRLEAIAATRHAESS
jgi:hypothetical protein